jgi:hypothetical protein
MHLEDFQPQLRMGLDVLATELLRLICDHIDDRDLLGLLQVSRRLHYIALHVYLERHGMPDPSKRIVLDTQKVEVFQALSTALFVKHTALLQCFIRGGCLNPERTILGFARFIERLDRATTVFLDLWNMRFGKGLGWAFGRGIRTIPQEAWPRLTGSLLNALSDKVESLNLQYGEPLGMGDYDISEELGMGRKPDAAAKVVSQIAESGSDVAPSPVELAATRAVKPALQRRALSLTRSANRALDLLSRAFHRSQKERKTIEDGQPPKEGLQSLVRRDEHAGSTSTRSTKLIHLESEMAPFHIRPMTSLKILHLQSRYLLHHPFLTWTIDTINSSAIIILKLLWLDPRVSSHDWGIFLSRLMIPSLTSLSVSLPQLRLKDVADFLSRHKVSSLVLTETTLIADSDNTLASELLQPALARMWMLSGSVSGSISVLLQDVQEMPSLSALHLNLEGNAFLQADEILRRLARDPCNQELDICLGFVTGQDLRRYVAEGLNPGVQRVECSLDNVKLLHIDGPSGHKVPKADIKEFTSSICSCFALFPNLTAVELRNVGLSYADAGADAALVRALRQTNPGIVTVTIDGVRESVRNWIALNGP